MKLGMILRADRRGLAYQTGEMWAALNPHCSVVVDMDRVNGPGSRWVQDFSQYPDAIISEWVPGDPPSLSDEAVAALLECDVVYSAETFYDRRIPQLARQKGIPTVKHVNCELWSDEGESHRWYPSEWRLPHVPEGPTVPVPIPDDKIVGPAGEGKLLHVAGWTAAYDRNGTKLVQAAVRRSSRGWRVTSQAGRVISRGNVEIVSEIEDRWDLYDGCSALVLPRRYGGLCLPAQEAAARGLALVMPNIPPNDGWPIVPLTPTRIFPMRRLKCDVTYTDPQEITALTDGLTGATLDAAQQAAHEWASGLAWSEWVGEYRTMFEQAIGEVCRSKNG